MLDLNVVTVNLVKRGTTFKGIKEGIDGRRRTCTEQNLIGEEGSSLDVQRPVRRNEQGLSVIMACNVVPNRIPGLDIFSVGGPIKTIPT